MELRKLEPGKHGRLVARLFVAASDYVQMTEGGTPGPAQAAGFFKGAPPGGDLAQSVKVGLFDGAALLGIADLAFGYPEPGDAYIGLMLFAPAARGQGLGKALLALLEEEARARGGETDVCRCGRGQYARPRLLAARGLRAGETFRTDQGRGAGAPD